METDLTNYRRWLLEDFKARVSPLIPEILRRNPSFEAFDLMEALKKADGKAVLKAEEQAYILDQYIVAKWSPPADTMLEPTTTRRPLRRPPLSGAVRSSMSPVHG